MKTTRKAITVDELRVYLNMMSETMYRGNWRICIIVPGGGVGGTSVVDVDGMSMGFDHDHGKMMLHPAEPLRRKKEAKHETP